MSWLVSDGTVLASLEVARSRRERRRGLLGRDQIEGALLLPGTRAVHTLGMRFAIDVAWCDRDLVVVRCRTVPPWRITRPVLGAHNVIEAEAGNLRRWGVCEGTELEVQR